MKHSVKSTGARVYVEPMPSPALLEGADEIVAAKAALDEANASSWEAAREIVAAQKRRGLAEIPSTFPALDDEVHAAEVASRAAFREAQAAGRRLAALLDEHGEDLARRAARRRVEAHVQACDAFAALSRSGLASLARPGLARQPEDLMPWVDPGGQARPNLVDLGRYLDETNVPAMLEEAGMEPEEAGLILVVRSVVGGVHRFLTTPARAALLDRLLVGGADGEEVA